VDQDFALVISGDLPLPGVGFVIMDRMAYAAPGRIHFELVDFSLPAPDSIPLLVRSTTEVAGETVVLWRNVLTGVYTGYLDTVRGPATNDQRLQMEHQDTIEAVYVDADPAGEHLTTARADLRPPEINQVAATHQFGKIIVNWSSDEPADSAVFWGTNPAALRWAATNAVFTEAHSWFWTAWCQGPPIGSRWPRRTKRAT